ncbi:MAG: hypothetical protein ACOZNI_13375 [Myxococcota bacterium]
MLLLLLAGCPPTDKPEGDDTGSPGDDAPDGDLVVTGGDEFGAVESVIWTAGGHVGELWLMEDGELVSAGEAVMSTQVSWYTTRLDCEDVRESWADFGEASAAYLSLATDRAAACEAFGDFLAETNSHEVGNQAWLRWCEDDLCLAPPSAGVHPVGDGASLEAAIRYDTDEAPPQDAWDPDACAFDADWPRDYVRRYLTGEADFTTATAARVAGTLEGDLLDDAGEPAGTVAADFDVARCELPDVGVAVVY